MRKIVRNYFLNIAGFFKKAKPGIHIINAHYVTVAFHKKELDTVNFEKFLKFLSSQGSFCTMEDALIQIEKNDISKNKVQFVLSFDDGFEECYTVIAPLLEKYGTRGSFFINANYVNSNLSYQKEFNERIHLTTKKPMTWLQIQDLHSRGHLIGSHTLDHENLSKLSNENIEIQIAKNKELLEKNIRYQCEYFAWPYGTEKDFPLEALQICEKHHNYIFSSANYKTYFSLEKRIINRRHIEPFWPYNHIKYFLSVNKK